MSDDPISKPGDPEAVGPEGGEQPSEKVVSSASVIFVAGTILLGMACLMWVDWLAGALLLVAGLVGFYIMIRRVMGG